MKRTLKATRLRTSGATLLLAAGLLLTGCGGNQSGDSNSDSQTDQAPGQPGDNPSPQS